MKFQKEYFKVSVVVPLFNEEGNVNVLTQEIVDILSKYVDYELIYIDDGSYDGTLDMLKQQNKKNKKVKFISFSRNFGHQNALRAGLDYATGDCVISMDGDMQHPPKLIPQLVDKWQKGYDIVYTIRKDDPSISFFKRKTANIFYWAMNKFSDIEIKSGVADFRLLDRSVLDIVKTIRENDLFIRGMVSWLGFRQYGIEYMPEKRNWGKTKYSFFRMTKFAITGMTSFSLKPLHISTMLGYIIATIAFLYGIYAIIIKLFTNNAISGWTSVLVVVLFIGGIQLIMIGILGEYTGKLFIESKKRPNYIIKEKKL